MDTYFIANDPTKQNIRASIRIINVCSMNPSIGTILCIFIFNITNINNPITNNKIVEFSIQPSFFHVIGCKSFEIFPKHNGYDFVSESFALN